MKDDKCYLFFNCYHSVAFASDALTRFRIDNRIVKAPIDLKGSCSFAVIISEDDLDMSRMVLKNMRMDVKHR